VSRAAATAAVTTGVVFLSLAWVHPLLELVVVFLAPAAIAAAFCGGIRDCFRLHARVAAGASGFAGAAWLIATASSGEAVVAVLIGAMVSFVLLVGLGFAGAAILDQIVTRRAAWRA
jgi:hypothetical protein